MDNFNDESKIYDLLNLYIDTDTNINILKNKIKEFNNIQKDREGVIMDIINTNNTGYTLNNYKFQTKSVNVTESITFKSLEYIFNMYFNGDSSRTMELLEFIRLNRKTEIKNVLDIKKKK
jgi:hypothetical protein